MDNFHLSTPPYLSVDNLRNNKRPFLQKEEGPDLRVGDEPVRQLMSSLTAAMTACRLALASPNSICVLSSKYSSFWMPA